MKTCDKYDIDRFLSSATLCPRGYAANLSLWHIYSVISFRGVLALCTGHHQQQQQHRQQQRHPHNFFCHQIYHQPSKVSTCVCVRGSWGVIFGQPPAEEAEKLGLICDKVRVALAVGKGKRGMIAACLLPPPAPFSAQPLPLLLPCCYLSAGSKNPNCAFHFMRILVLSFFFLFRHLSLGLLIISTHIHTHIQRSTHKS